MKKIIHIFINIKFKNYAMKKNLNSPFCLIILLIFSLFFSEVKGQNAVVTGTVTDEAGELLPGVNVVEKGTTNGTSTGMDGKFSISVSGNSSVLVFSYIGYVNREIIVENQRSLHVILKEDLQSLDEVVVIGYGTARKRDLTGAISTVHTETLEIEAPRTVHDLLRANGAGLSIKMSSDARGTGDMQIRGKNTLTAGSSPLIVLDGVIYQGGLEDINPNDIKTIDVLKDASSVAVYGAKAASGVIAITTKKGNVGKPSISFNSNVGLAHVVNLPKMLDGPGFLQFRYDYEVGKTTASDLEKYPGKFMDPRKLSGSGVDQLAWYNYTQGTPVTSLPSEEALVRAWLTRLELKAPEIENYLSGRVTDWDDLVFQTGLQQDYTVSLSNKTDNLSYYWSIGYTDREGVREDERYTNFRTRLNLESKVTSFLTVGMNASFNTRDDAYMPRDNQKKLADVGQRENLSPYSANEIDNPESPYRMYPNADNNSKNPFYDAMFRDVKKLEHFFNANVYAQVFLPFGIEYQVNYTPYYRFYEYYWHETKEHEEWTASGGRSHRQHEKDFNWMLDNIIRWKKTFNNIHKVELTLLQNAEQGQFWKTEANNTQYSPSDILGYHRLQAGTVPTVSSEDKYKTADALMARLFYSYEDRYMITASVRRDGYSAFGQENPRATFPSVALGWVFSSEKFTEGIADVLNYGKLRLSWGENGNRDFGSGRDQYQALSDLTSGPHPYIDQNGNLYISSQLWVNRMANKGLKWERTEAYNFGLDFSLFNDLVSGSVDAYVSETNDLLVLRSLPTILGFDNVMANIGKVGNKGLEVSLSSTPVHGRNFSWNTSANFSLNRRKIKTLYGEIVNVLDNEGNIIGQKEADDIGNSWFIGQDPDRIWDYVRDGVWQLGEEAEAAKYGCQPGDFKYLDLNDDGVMTNDDKKFQEYKTPRYRWSWRNEFTFYRNFSLSFMMYSLWGNYDTYNRAANAVSLADRRSWFDIKRWTPEHPENDYARIGSKNLGNNYASKSFIRLENVSLTYNVPKNLLNKVSIQNMRISLSIRNAGLWAPGWEFGDPEVGDISPRTYNLGINFTL
jgi:TonB-linked SusC/RagA family outer membrane protein